MSALVRQLRLQVLHQNLRLVIQLKDTMVERQRAVDELLRRPKAWVDQLAEARKGPLRVLEDALSVLALEVDTTELDDARRALQEAVTRLEGELSKGLRDSQELAQRYFRLPESRDTGYKDLFTFIDLADELERRLTEESLVLDSRRCDDLFAEYVDLLRGIALRDSGVRVHGRDLTDVFRIADALPALWGRAEGWGWRSVTVPSSMERPAPGASNALRIGFPEWTVWALPLVQTELGSSFLTRARVPGTEAPDVAALAADAAATLVCGPAYALPALLLRLRPEDAVDPGSTAARRAAMVLAALDAAGDADLSLGVSGVAATLAAEWASAVADAGGDPAEVAGRPARADLQALLVLVRAAMEQATAVAGTPDPTVLAWAREWGTVLTWAQAMRAALAAGAEAPLVLEVDVAAVPRPDSRVIALPMLLSAAWLVRAGLDGSPPLAATSVEPLAVAVVDRCLLALPATDGGPAGRPTSARGSNR